LINKKNWKDRMLLMAAAFLAALYGETNLLRGRPFYKTWYGQPMSSYFAFSVAAILVLAALFMPDRKFDPKSLRRPSRFPAISRLLKRWRKPVD
jgi:hypothetical protein